MGGFRGYFLLCGKLFREMGALTRRLPWTVAKLVTEHVVNQVGQSNVELSPRQPNRAQYYAIQLIQS